MPRYAMVNDEKGFVANVVMWSGDEADWIPPEGHSMVNVEEIPCGPGYTYEGGEFIPPPDGQPGTSAQALIAEAEAAHLAAQPAADEEFKGVPAEEPSS